MTIKKLCRFTILSLLIFAFLVGTLLTGCARHPSPEELNQLEQTKAAALAAEEEAEAKAQERMEWEQKLKQKQEELNQAEEDLKAVQEAVAEKK
jgi:septal ring factor EnvC (AmiA/AmiB activator)